jgi:hypothetical protein
MNTMSRKQRKHGTGGNSFGKMALASVLAMMVAIVLPDFLAGSG